MSSKSKIKQSSFKSISAADDMKYKRKYKDLKKKIREMEEENEKLNTKLNRAKKNMQRLRLERSFLFDRLEQTQPMHDSDSEVSSRAPQQESEEDLSSSDDPMHEDIPVSGTKRRRQHKDPNAPKRPRNAFLMYCQMEREQAKEEHANKGFQDVTRILSQRWKDLPADEKQKYYDMYNREKQRYEREMSTYVGSSLQSYTPDSVKPEEDVDEEPKGSASGLDEADYSSHAATPAPSVPPVTDADGAQAEAEAAASVSASASASASQANSVKEESQHQQNNHDGTGEAPRSDEDDEEEEEEEEEEEDEDSVMVDEEDEMSEEVDELREELDESEEKSANADASQGRAEDEVTVTDVDENDEY